MKNWLFILFTMSFVFIMCSFVEGKANQPPEMKDKPENRDAPIWNEGQNVTSIGPPIIEKIKDGIFRIGNILVSKHEHSASVIGSVNMTEGFVEYLACSPNGKVHESIFIVDADPYHLQIALLLLGFEPGNKPIQAQGAPGKLDGDPLKILISWVGQDKKTNTCEAEKFVLNQNTNKSLDIPHWIFTGSQIINGKFMGHVEQSIVAVYHDPYAIIDHPLESGTDDNLHSVNSKLVPPKGTPVTFILKSLK